MNDTIPNLRNTYVLIYASIPNRVLKHNQWIPIYLKYEPQSIVETQRKELEEYYREVFNIYVMEQIGIKPPEAFQSACTEAFLCRKAHNPEIVDRLYVFFTKFPNH